MTQTPRVDHEEEMNRAAWKSYEDELLRVAARYCGDVELARLKKAIEFGARNHRDQTRISGEPYFTHPLAVAFNVANIQMPIDGVIAAVLHDVLEDCEVTRQELEQQFGHRVAELVEGVSKLKASGNSRQNDESLTLRRLVRAAARDPLVFIIKIADRLHNISTLDVMTREKQERITGQTEQIFIPIAQRLGLYAWAEVLEDQCLRIRRPRAYKTIADEIEKKYGSRKHKKAFAEFTKEVEGALSAAGIDAKVSSRVKKASAVYKKIKKADRSVEDLSDIFGVRIIVADRPSCYQALGVIHTTFKPKFDELKDYIAVPKSNNYQSIHTKINHSVLDVVDIQIRDGEMDEVAATGIAAHWRYKSEWDKNYSKFLTQLSELVMPDEARQYTEQIRESLQTDIQVYTPKNKLIDLPAGSTALDFAYYVHTEVGARAQKAEINGQVASIFSALNTGDRVRIKTSSFVRPTYQWLDHVVSARARNAIRVQLAKNSQLMSGLTGRRLIRNELRKYKVQSFDLSSKERQQIADKHGVKDWRSVVLEVGRGFIDVKQLVNEVIFSKGFAEAEPSDDELRVVLGNESGGEFYSCQHCLPIPGDKVLGVMVPDRGLVVHRDICSVLQESLKNGHSRVTVEWGNTGDNLYPTALFLDTENRPRVLASLASAIANNEVNIESVSVTERGRVNSEIHFKIMVSGRKQLADIIRSLRATGVLFGISRTRSQD